MEKIILVILLISLKSLGHQGEIHKEDSKENNMDLSQVQLELINESYQKNVAPLFKSQCFDCHGIHNKLPWYYKLPIAKNIMDDDMSEAKKHLDVSAGFPFKGHGTPEKDLVAIAKVINENEMPPLRYKIFHWTSRFSENEKQDVQKWIDESLKKIKEANL